MKENQFETIKQLDEDGSEFWSSRDLCKALEYKDYRNFLTALKRARIACAHSEEIITDHFVDTT